MTAWGAGQHLDRGVVLDFGTARARVSSLGIASFGSALARVYGEFEPIDDDGICEVSVLLRPVTGNWLKKPEIELVSDGARLFDAFAPRLHLPLFEWGVNFLLAQRLLHLLLLHAGSVALDDRAIVMPALPGSGKSTLTAALACRGFRLLSDEFGLVNLDSGMLHPLVRPICLKNESIEVIRRLWPSAVLGPEFAGTRKGTVAHVAPNAQSVSCRYRPAKPVAIVFPRYRRGASLVVERVTRASAFNSLAVNSFNYTFLGPLGFRCVARLVEQCPVYRLSYDRLDEAVACLQEIVADRRPSGLLESPVELLHNA
jgi:HprK-related kinase A